MNESRITDTGLMTFDEVAEFLSCSRPTVYALVERGKLPSLKIGTLRRIPRKAVVELAERELAREAK